MLSAMAEGKILRANLLSAQTQARKEMLLQLYATGMTILEALGDARVGVSYSAYRQWRARDPHFAAKVDLLRVDRDNVEPAPRGSRAEFAKKYFGMQYAAFQLMFLNEVDQMPPGNIVMCLWPPEHGKTTTFENYATEQLAVDPQFRMTVASANIRIASKIVSRVKNRLEPSGPFKQLVRDHGPFKPPVGMGRHETVAQPWSSQVFNVYKKADQDERDYNMQALGFKSEIVSTRCDHLHLDDLQSLKNLGQAEAMEEWVRQDALSRPGMSGKTSIVGTRVGEDDIYERLASDGDLDGILKVLKFKAITTDYTDPDNPVEMGLWPEKYTLDDYDRMRRKAGAEAWDRGYMMNPGASRKDATFQDSHIDPCKNPQISLLHRPTQGSFILVGLDPALGGMNCIIACEQRSDPKPKLIVRAIREAKNLRSNEQIMQELNQVIALMNQTGRTTDVVIETMNFQKGLARDERLLEMRQHYGFAMREHLTGWNKYDEDIGVASMVTSFIKREIELPWAEDPTTRNEIGELIRQLKAWRPGARGTKLRQDRVMALWFVWILWQSRWKRTNQSSGNTETLKRQGVPWRGTKSGLIIPVGAKI